LDTTPRQARSAAEAFLAAAGLEDFCIGSVQLRSMTTADGSERQCYELRCLRSVNGVPVASPDGVCSRTDAGEYGIEWYYEGLVLSVTDEGIATVRWNAPLEILDTVTDDASLLPYAEISTILQTILALQEEQLLNTGAWEAVSLRLHSVTLSLQRVSDRNAHREGLLIPVWNVYGERSMTAADGSVREEFSRLPLITINAIDGSVIDAAQGY
ncbi:MAG: DUF6034 family protein, partial [Clostridia bacterium]|nr:DUF6034 family protein [Clostridia bacterium]